MCKWESLSCSSASSKAREPTALHFSLSWSKYDPGHYMTSPTQQIDHPPPPTPHTPQQFTTIRQRTLWWFSHRGIDYAMLPPLRMDDSVYLPKGKIIEEYFTIFVSITDEVSMSPAPLLGKERETQVLWPAFQTKPPALRNTWPPNHEVYKNNSHFSVFTIWKLTRGLPRWAGVCEGSCEGVEVCIDWLWYLPGGDCVGGCLSRTWTMSSLKPQLGLMRSMVATASLMAVTVYHWATLPTWLWLVEWGWRQAGLWSPGLGPCDKSGDPAGAAGILGPTCCLLITRKPLFVSNSPTARPLKNEFSKEKKSLALLWIYLPLYPSISCYCVELLELMSGSHLLTSLFSSIRPK